MEDFITIAVFNNVHEIEILKHRLNLEGIAYHFENEAITTIAPWYSLASGIKLRIHPNDTEAVREILNEFDQGNNLKIV